MHQKINDVHELMFPVRAVPVYADLRGGANMGLSLDLDEPNAGHHGDSQEPGVGPSLPAPRRPVAPGLYRIPGRKAIVNCTNETVLSVVSDDYQIVTNREALYYGQLCCKAAFPESRDTEWDVLRAHAPSTMGSCRVDLVHPSSMLDFDGLQGSEQRDTYAPFVRVTNSYNRSRALAFEVGFIRWICSNGMILSEASIHFSFNHNTRNIFEHVEIEVQDKRFKQLRERFRKFLEPLRKCRVPRVEFTPATLAVLRINKPDPIKKRQEEPWEKLAAHLESTADRYVYDMGDNAYALMNVISDVASEPPRSPFIRREQHSLQKSAGSWLEDFSMKCRTTGFDVKAYFDNFKKEADSRAHASKT